MGELRIIHFADLHLGVEAGGRTDPSTGLNQRIVDVCHRLDELCAVAEADGVHAVLFAGDAFKHQHPTTTWQRLFAERIRRLARGGTAVFLLIGNHDLPKMAGLAHPFSIYSALEVDGVVVGERAMVYRLPLGPDAPAPALQVAALPHFSRHAALARLDDVEDPRAFIDEQVARTVSGLGQAAEPGLPGVFVGHCHVHQADLGAGQSLFGVSEVEVSLSTLVGDRGFPYYALGHIHRRQVLLDDPFVAYPGSLERVDFGEGDVVSVDGDLKADVRSGEPKGFYRADLAERDGSWVLAEPPRFVEVGARAFVTVRCGELDERDPVADLQRRLEAVAPDQVHDAFVRVVCAVARTDVARLRAALPERLVAGAYDVRLQVEATDEQVAVRDPRFARPMTEVDALDAYLATRDDWADDREGLLAAGRALIGETLG